MEDENKNEEKLIASPEAPELLDSGETEQFLSGKEFIAKTSLAELKNVFGITDKELPDPKNPAPTPPVDPVTYSEMPSRPESLLPELHKKQIRPGPQAANRPGNSAGTWKKILRFSLMLFLIIIVIVIVLYVWGGIITLSTP